MRGVWGLYGAGPGERRKRLGWERGRVVGRTRGEPKGEWVGVRGG